MDLDLIFAGAGAAASSRTSPLRNNNSLFLTKFDGRPKTVHCIFEAKKLLLSLVMV